jgi:acetylglutamate kinase
MENNEARDSLLRDVAFMSSVGIKVVLVHGGGKAISRALDLSGIKSEFIMGLRVTSEEAIEVVERVLKREVNAEIVRALRRDNANAHPLHGDWIIRALRKTARPLGSEKTIDWGFVGEPISVDTRPITEMTDAGIIPVITPLGLSEFDRIYNINADTAASAVAEALRARKLAFISDVPGLLRDKDDPHSLI